MFDVKNSIFEDYDLYYKTNNKQRGDVIRAVRFMSSWSKISHQKLNAITKKHNGHFFKYHFGGGYITYIRFDKIEDANACAVQLILIDLKLKKMAGGQLKQLLLLQLHIDF